MSFEILKFVIRNHSLRDTTERLVSNNIIIYYDNIFDNILSIGNIGSDYEYNTSLDICFNVYDANIQIVVYKTKQKLRFFMPINILDEFDENIFVLTYGRDLKDETLLENFDKECINEIKRMIDDIKT